MRTGRLGGDLPAPGLRQPAHLDVPLGTLDLNMLEDFGLRLGIEAAVPLPAAGMVILALYRQALPRVRSEAPRTATHDEPRSAFPSSSSRFHFLSGAEGVDNPVMFPPLGALSWRQQTQLATGSSSCSHDDWESMLVASLAATSCRWNLHATMTSTLPGGLARRPWRREGTIEIVPKRTRPFDNAMFAPRPCSRSSRKTLTERLGAVRDLAVEPLAPAWKTYPGNFRCLLPGPQLPHLPRARKRLPKAPAILGFAILDHFGKAQDGVLDCRIERRENRLEIFSSICLAPLINRLDRNSKNWIAPITLSARHSDWLRDCEG